MCSFGRRARHHRNHQDFYSSEDISSNELVTEQSQPVDRKSEMSGGGLIALGLGLAGAGILGRIALKNARQARAAAEAIKQQIDSIPGGTFSKYYRGGFDQKMTKREASLILGVGMNAPKNRVKEAHKRVMLANHPDRGGSPYLAAKINEAKDLLDNPTRGGRATAGSH